jgi:hypothetical protein
MDDNPYQSPHAPPEYRLPEKRQRRRHFFGYLLAGVLGTMAGGILSEVSWVTAMNSGTFMTSGALIGIAVYRFWP